MWYVRCSTKHYNFLGRRFFVTVELGLICVSRLTSFITGMCLGFFEENVTKYTYYGVTVTVSLVITNILAYYLCTDDEDKECNLDVCRYIQ